MLRSVEIKVNGTIPIIGEKSKSKYKLNSKKLDK